MKKYENPSLEVNALYILEDISEINISKMDDGYVEEENDEGAEDLT